MKLLTDIVDLLMTEKGSLTEALLKTKVLLHRLGQANLVGWVDSELTGYSSSDTIPDFRRLHGAVFGTVTNGYWIHNHHQIPLRHLEDKHRDRLERHAETHSIDVIEKMVVGTENGNTYSIPIEPEICALLSKVLQGGYYIQSASTYFQILQFRQILIQVRSRLLSFVLQLQSELGESMNDADAKSAAARLDVPSMFNGAMFGDNVTIMVGHNGQQSVHNTNSTQDMNAVASELRKHKVAEEDIEALHVALDQDPQPSVPEQYGPAVQKWMVRMLSKAADSSWKISLSAAGGVLASVVKGYYGI